MIHILVDMPNGSSFFLKRELLNLNIRAKVYDIPNYNIKDRTKKWRLPNLYLKYFILANKSIKNSQTGDIIICWNFTTSIALGYLCMLFNKSRTILALNIIAHKKGVIGEVIRRFIFNPVMRQSNYYLTVNSSKYIMEYSERFKINTNKFFELNDPIQDNTSELFKFTNSYVFVGGEANRDWETLFKTAKLLPNIHFVCIARKKNFNISLPNLENVVIYFDTTNKFFYEKMKEASLVVIPLKSKLPSGLIILLKASMMNKAIIATDTPSIRNYIIDNNHGLLFKIGDELDLANSIKKLFYDATLQKKLTANLFNHIQINFSQEKYAENLSLIIDLIKIDVQ